MTIISISISDELINKIDKTLRIKGYVSRSEVIREALRRFLHEEEISENDIVLATIMIVIDKENSEVEGKIMRVLHKYSTKIMNFTHIQDKDRCIESIIYKGSRRDIQELLLELRRLRGKIIIRESLIPLAKQ